MKNALESDKSKRRKIRWKALTAELSVDSVLD